MSATVDTGTDWQAEVLDLKRQGLSSAQIAEAVGKHAATVRKVIARASTDDEPIAGQTTVDDHLSEDPLEEFKREAGEPVGDMPPREMDGGEVVETVRLKGTRQMALDFGPNAAVVTSGTVVFKSEKLASGYFEMGDVVTGTFTARVVAINGAEKFDKDIEDYVAKPQAHVALITEIEIEAVGDDT